MFNGKKNIFKKNPFFRIYAEFEADFEKDSSSIGNKTTKIYKQNPILNGYHIMSEVEDVLQNSYHKSPLGYNNVDWFVNEVIKLENKMAFYFKNTEKDNLIIKEDEEDCRNNNICRFCEKQKYYLIKLEIIVIQQNHTEELLIINVKLM